MTDHSHNREERNRLAWRCRQGSRELEIVLYRFLEHGYTSMNRQQQLDFQRLLEHSNSELTDWLLFGATGYDEMFSPVITKIRNCQTTQP